MNGAMFNSLARFVQKNYPQISFSDLCREASMRTNIFAELTWYPDQDFISLMKILSKQMEKEPATLWREFGKETFLYFADIFGDYMKKVTSLDELLTAINKIHDNIGKDGLGTPPRFEFRKASSNHFEMEYTSNRDLNDFFLGMLEGVAKHFQTSVQIIGRKERGKLVACITTRQPEMAPAW
jgi:hypothetical protein